MGLGCATGLSFMCWRRAQPTENEKPAVGAPSAGERSCRVRLRNQARSTLVPLGGTTTHRAGEEWALRSDEHARTLETAGREVKAESHRRVLTRIGGRAS